MSHSLCPLVATSDLQIKEVAAVTSHSLCPLVATSDLQIKEVAAVTSGSSKIDISA